MQSPTSFPRRSSAGRVYKSAEALSPLRLDMAVWAEPIIADCIGSAYKGRGLSASFLSLLSLQHRRFWRALILENRGVLEQLRIELAQDLTRAGLAPETGVEVDNAVMEELMDIVITRFRNSRDAATGFSRVLLSAASQIGAPRPLAA